ncbi:MAG: hypothetical protein M3Y58_01920, partial [Chloroflexota bacterium]|nr:hypothetical protein [Chloroflexota bacterium]
MADEKQQVSRREAMKTALKAGVYAAPVILAASIPAGVAAASPPPPPPPPPGPCGTVPVLSTIAITQQPAFNSRFCGGGPSSQPFVNVAITALTVTCASPNTTYELTVASADTDVITSNIIAGTLTTDANGSATFATTLGPNTLTQLDVTSGKLPTTLTVRLVHPPTEVPVFASVDVTNITTLGCPTPLSASVAPIEGPVGTVFTVTGKNYPANSQVTVAILDSNGTQVLSQSAPVNGVGGFTATIDTSSFTVSDTYEVTVNGQHFGLFGLIFGVLPSVTATPPSAPFGTVFRITGAGYLISPKRILINPVYLWINTPDNVTVVQPTVPVDASGKFTTSYDSST